MSETPLQTPVEAAGGVIVRAGPDGHVEVALVHRQRRQDWSFPKGHLEAGETHLDAAIREVLEETGFRVSVGDAMGDLRYTDHKGRPKRVAYWVMSIVGGAFRPNDEVDLLVWCDVATAAAMLTYDGDRGLLARLDPDSGRTLQRRGPERAVER